MDTNERKTVQTCIGGRNSRALLTEDDEADMVDASRWDVHKAGDRDPLRLWAVVDQLGPPPLHGPYLVTGIVSVCAVLSAESMPSRTTAEYQPTSRYRLFIGKNV